jgi:hypothetical protein
LPDWWPSPPQPATSTAWERLRTGLIASILVWLSWNKLSKTRPFRAVDDALGVVHTHSLFMSLRMPDAVEALTSAGEFRHPQDS